MNLSTNQITYLIIFNRARPSPNLNLNNLTGSGRLDVCCRAITTTFFLSNEFRNNVTFIGFFNAIEKAIIIDGKKVRGVNPDERSTAGFIRSLMSKKRLRGARVTQKKLNAILNSLKNPIVLQEEGNLIEMSNFSNKIKLPISFILGDDQGLETTEFQNLLNDYPHVSIGSKKYLTSTVISILNYMVDQIKLMS